jgi:hypothetical protein
VVWLSAGRASSSDKHGARITGWKYPRCENHDTGYGQANPLSLGALPLIGSARKADEGHEMSVFLRLRRYLFAAAAVAMLAGASGELSPAVSAALWLPSLLVFACGPSSPVRRAVGRGMRLPVDQPQALMRSGTSLTPYDHDAPAARRGVTT